MNDELKVNGYNARGIKTRDGMVLSAWYYSGHGWNVEILTAPLCDHGGLTINAEAKTVATAERRALAKLQRVLRREAGKLLAMADRLEASR